MNVSLTKKGIWNNVHEDAYRNQVIQEQPPPWNLTKLYSYCNRQIKNKMFDRTTTKLHSISELARLVIRNHLLWKAKRNRKENEWRNLTRLMAHHQLKHIYYQYPRRRRDRERKTHWNNDRKFPKPWEAFTVEHLQ